MYEAARIDGASKLQIVTRITLPLLVPTIMIMTLLAVGKIFQRGLCDDLCHHWRQLDAVSDYRRY
ncbi:ABC transporter permease subunit [Paenibacillus rhizoplanae]